MGDLWWYTILLFAAQRFGDFINMFVGLWLVPKYVEPGELGAVLPLTQVVGVIGLPFGLAAIPFMKFLNLYAARGEMGKIKALLRDVFLSAGVLALATFAIAGFVLPHFFERMRVATGSLGLLIVFVSVISSVSAPFENAVKGLNLYSTTVWIAALAAPLRLVMMLVSMPFRALSGYFVGQAAYPFTILVASLWALRGRLGRAVKTVSYWREDGPAIIRYAIPVMAWTVVTTVFSTVDSLVIRHRLSDFESAGYYMVTRFTDISSYLGMAFTTFLFPMVASRSENDAGARKVLWHSVAGTAVGGLLVGALLHLCGGFILDLNSLWRPYMPMARFMLPICFLNVLIVGGGCMATYDIAQGRFGFLKYAIPITVGKGVFVYALTGFGFFRGIVPDVWVDVVEAFNPCRLSVVLAISIVAQLALMAIMTTDFVLRSRRRVASVL